MKIAFFSSLCSRVFSRLMPWLLLLTISLCLAYLKSHEKPIMEDNVSWTTAKLESLTGLVDMSEYAAIVGH